MSEKKNNPGTLVISLDFELHWGMREVVSLESFKKQLLGTYEAVPAILELFEKYNISATWAIVGFLHYQNAAELRQNIPQKLPSYINSELSPYPYVEKLATKERDDLHFCSDTIDLIQKYPQQEIGTHTFSHYYCLEKGQTAAEFKADLEAAIKIAKTRNIEPKSLIFPRNQYNEDYLKIIESMGITSYRGNETSSMYNSSDGNGGKLNKRVLRLLDSYLNISGNNCYDPQELNNNCPINIPSSRFLRPHSPKLKYLESLRLRRITSGLTYAGNRGLIYHLWWHPHNFGLNLRENMRFLENVLRYYQKLEKQGKMRSLSMGKLTESMNKL